MDALEQWLIMTGSVMVGIVFVKLFFSVIKVPIISDIVAMV